ncbi:hypothetical protein BGZ65_007650, partial [Modicella reniformis]
MKDGLVIPQPIFVNDDDNSGEDDAMVERYIVDTRENGVRGSKKRSREEDLQEQRHEEELQQQQSDVPVAPSKSWVSLTGQRRNKRRLLASHRKMASVRDFFAESSPSVL